MNTNTLNYILIGTSAAALGYAFYTVHKMKNVAEKLNVTLDYVEENAEVDISDDIIQTAVNRAVNREAGVRIEKATEAAVKDIKADINSQVRTAVNDSYKDIASEVKEELKKQIGHVNLDSIRSQIVREAKEAATSKFQSDLDTILESYNHNLNNVDKIYGSIAESLANRPNQKSNGPTFQIV